MKKLLVLGVLCAIVLLSYPLWKPLAKRNKWFVIATNIGQDSLRRIGWKSQQIQQTAVLTPPESNLGADIAHAQAVYDNYLRYAGWEASQATGKRILELGPGAHMGVPLLFAAHGASYVAGLDKFVPFQTGPYFQRLYEQLRNTLSEPEKAGFDGAIQLQPRIALQSSRAGYFYGKELSDCVGQLGPGTYDLIASNAVIEEIYNPQPVFEAQGRLLRPGGVMVHKIDLRDYGMFTKYGFPALEFLTVPDRVYRLMVEASGQPNRLRVNYYRDVVERLGYQSQIYVTHLLGVEPELFPAKTQLTAADTAQGAPLLEQIRPRLAARFHNLPDTDLLIQGIILVARKPGR